MSPEADGWFVERGIGEDRAVLLERGAVVAARLDWPGSARGRDRSRTQCCFIANAGSRRGTARFANGEEALVDRLARDAAEGAPIRLEITRAALAERGRLKRAQARPTDAAAPPCPGCCTRRAAGCARGPPLSRRCRLGRRWFADAWEGSIAFDGGTLLLSDTPAMTLIDVDTPARTRAGSGRSARRRRRDPSARPVGRDRDRLPFARRQGRSARGRRRAGRGAGRLVARAHRDERVRLCPARRARHPPLDPASRRPPPHRRRRAAVAAPRRTARRAAPHVVDRASGDRGKAARRMARGAGAADGPALSSSRAIRSLPSMRAMPRSLCNERRTKALPDLPCAPRRRTRAVLLATLPRPRPGTMVRRWLRGPRSRRLGRRDRTRGNRLVRGLTAATRGLPQPRDLPIGGRAARIAQLVEHTTENRGVGGSNPPPGTFLFSRGKLASLAPPRGRPDSRRAVALWLPRLFRSLCKKPSFQRKLESLAN